MPAHGRRLNFVHRAGGQVGQGPPSDAGGGFEAAPASGTGIAKIRLPHESRRDRRRRGERFSAGDAEAVLGAFELCYVWVVEDGLSDMQFAGFILKPDCGTLVENGRPIALRAKSFALLAAIDRARQLSPFDPFLCSMHASRAIGLLRLGRFRDAAKWGQRAAVQPNAHAHVRRLQAICLVATGKVEQAREQIQQIDRQFRRAGERSSSSRFGWRRTRTGCCAPSERISVTVDAHGLAAGPTPYRRGKTAEPEAA